MILSRSILSGSHFFLSPDFFEYFTAFMVVGKLLQLVSYDFDSGGNIYNLQF